MTEQLTDPTSDQFWDEEEERLWETLAAIALAAYLSGAALGANQIAAQVAGVSSAQVVNLIGQQNIEAAARRFLAEYRLVDISNISDTTRTAATEVIDGWLGSGEDIDELKRLLGELPELGEGRASVIAVTENTRLISEGKLASWEESGVIGMKSWAAVMDDRTTPICRALNGQVRPLGQPFVVPADAIAGNPELAAMVRAFGNTFDAPPAHPNCRSDIIPVPDERALIRRLNDEIS